MHYHCEVIVPPTDDVESAIKQVLTPYAEGFKDEEGYKSKHGFYDFYVIGGRYAGSKQVAGLDPVQLEIFYKWLSETGITVSTLTFGKQSLSPGSQIPMVDAKWNEMFPHEGGKQVACPLFSHSNDQYGREGRGTISGDICLLSEALSIKCDHVIFGSLEYDSDTKLEAIFMLKNTAWNGVNHMPIAWDRTVSDALKQFRDKIDHYSEEYKKKVSPANDWLCVTVDYHS